jgi:hypothetical protein
MRATEKETMITPSVKISLECFHDLKNAVYSSINPVITHSRPPICKTLLIPQITVDSATHSRVQPQHDQHEKEKHRPKVGAGKSGHRFRINLENESGP